MIAHYNRLSLRWGAPGLVLQVAGAAWRREAGDVTPAFLLLLAGTVLLMVGLAYYAKAKEQPAAWCLVGLLSFAGILVLALLEDKNALENALSPEELAAGKRTTAGRSVGGADRTAARLREAMVLLLVIGGTAALGYWIMKSAQQERGRELSTPPVAEPQPTADAAAQPTAPPPDAAMADYTVRTAGPLRLTPVRLEPGAAGPDSELVLVGADQAGGFYVAGDFGEEGVRVAEHVLPGAGGRTVFLAKLDGDGPGWIRSYPATQTYYVQMSVGRGRVCLAGNYQGTIGFDGIEFESQSGVFATCVDSTGHRVWARSFEISSGDYLSVDRIAVAPSGDLLLAGSFQGWMKFGPEWIRDRDGLTRFLTRLDPSGGEKWSIAIPGQALGSVTALAVTNKGTALLIGGRADERPNVERYSAKGKTEKEWPAAPEGCRDAHLVNLAVGADGDIFAIGHCEPATVTESEGLYTPRDTFVTRFGPNGERRWERRLATSGGSLTRLVVDAAGSLIAAGTLHGPVAIGAPWTLDPRGSTYLAGLQADGAVVWGAAPFQGRSQIFDIAMAGGRILISGVDHPDDAPRLRFLLLADRAATE